MKLSQIIKQYRKKHSLTLEELSKRSILSKGFLSRLEKGDFDDQNVSLNTIVKLATAFKVPVIDLLDLLDITRKNRHDSPSLRVYLRSKYDIHDDETVKVVESLIDHLSK